MNIYLRHICLQMLPCLDLASICSQSTVDATIAELHPVVEFSLYESTSNWTVILQFCSEQGQVCGCELSQRSKREGYIHITSPTTKQPSTLQSFAVAYP